MADVFDGQWWVAKSRKATKKMRKSLRTLDHSRRTDLIEGDSRGTLKPEEQEELSTMQLKCKTVVSDYNRDML